MEQLEQLLGQPVATEQWMGAKDLPLYLTGGRQFDVIHLENTCFLSVTLSEENDFNVLQLGKQREKIEQAAQMPVAYRLHTASAYQRDSLIRHGIPFLLLPKQIYLPFLGVVLQKGRQEKSQKTPKRLQAAAQQVFLMLFYHREEQLQKSELAQRLGITKTSITRAVAQLEELGVLDRQTELRRPVSLKANADLRKNVENRLITPVQQTIVVEQAEIPVGLPLAGESALAEYTMLNPPKIPVFACYKQAEWLKQTKVLDPQWDDLTEAVRLELWKYRPTLFAKENKVDPISLYCSLKSVEDERVQGELEEMLEGIEW